MKGKILIILVAAIFVVLTVGLFGTGQIAFADERAAHEHEHDLSLTLMSLIKPLGICALSLLLITFLTVLFRMKLGRRFLKIHKLLAYITVIVAVTHGILVLVLH